MRCRIVPVVLAVLLVGALLAPMALAVTPSPPAADATLVVDGGIDTPVFDRIRAAVASPGLSRADEPLEQPTRAAVFDAIESSPGLALGSLAGVVGIAPTTARYHVKRLRRAGLIDTTRLGGSLRLAPTEMDIDLAAARSEPSTAAILDAVSRHEPAAVTTVAAATDRAPSTVSHHLSNLERRGLVERERVGEAVLTSLLPPVRAALALESDEASAEATADD